MQMNDERAHERGELEPGDAGGEPAYTRLAAYRHCVDRMRAAWPAFTARRLERLQQGLFDAPVEKVAENILEDLFTTVLDWPIADINLQVGRADVILSELGIKRLVLEVKRPGSLVWHRRAVEAALDQARRYAAAQRVGAVAVSDGTILYAADVVAGGLHDRVLVSLDSASTAPGELWWVSVHGIYRPCPVVAHEQARLLDTGAAADCHQAEDVMLHPRYGVGMECFAYVGSADSVYTWKLPYLLSGGAPDTKRLPKAIQSILSNYRGAKVDIPRSSVGDVLVRLALAASALRKLPCQCETTSDTYLEAHQALVQLNRLADVGCCSPPAP
ncbi:MAG: hypothetical protein ACRD0Z_17835 [Acidimicrobiales bacterium]